MFTSHSMTLINTWKPNKFKSPYRYYRDTIYPLYCRDTQESGEAKETPEVDEEGFTIRPPSAESILDCVLIKLKKNKTIQIRKFRLTGTLAQYLPHTYQRQSQCGCTIMSSLVIKCSVTKQVVLMILWNQPNIAYYVQSFIENTT